MNEHAARVSIPLFALAAALLSVAGFVRAEAESEDNAKSESIPPALDFEMARIDGEPVHLSQYRGDVVLMVNTASQCGFTPQYAGLQTLHEQYHERGLSILGFPANDFGNQEPGDNEQIHQFCEVNYGVTFDLFAKVSVKGEQQCALYQHLTDKETNPDFAGPVKWNFEKFLLNREGTVIARFRSKVKPTSDAMIDAIETALAENAQAKQQ